MDQSENTLDHLPEQTARELAGEVKRIVGDGCGGRKTLREISEALYVSRTHLCTAFKCETGMSIGAYLRRMRMEKAKQLLSSTRLPIAHIARATGYEKQGSFSEAFKEETGLTPTQWRKRREESSS